MLYMFFNISNRNTLPILFLFSILYYYYSLSLPTPSHSLFTRLNPSMSFYSSIPDKWCWSLSGPPAPQEVCPRASEEEGGGTPNRCRHVRHAL